MWNSIPRTTIPINEHCSGKGVETQYGSGTVGADGNRAAPDRTDCAQTERAAEAAFAYAAGDACRVNGARRAARADSGARGGAGIYHRGGQSAADGVPDAGVAGDSGAGAAQGRIGYDQRGRNLRCPARPPDGIPRPGGSGESPDC